MSNSSWIQNIPICLPQWPMIGMWNTLYQSSVRDLYDDITSAMLRIKSRANQSSNTKVSYSLVRARYLRFRFYSRSVLGTINLISWCSHISSRSVSPLTDSVLSSSRSTWQHACAASRNSIRRAIRSSEFLDDWLRVWCRSQEND